MSKTKRVALTSIITFFLLILALLSSLLYYRHAYAGKILQNVSFEGSDLSGLSQNAALKLVDQKVIPLKQKEFTLLTGSKEIKAKLGDTGINLDANKIVEDAYAIGRNPNFLKELVGLSKTIWQKTKINPEYKTDEAAYKSFEKIAVDQLSIEPKDASISINQGKVVTTESQDGQVANTVALQRNIEELYFNSNNRIALETIPVAPKVKMVDLASAQSEATSYLGKSIGLVFEGRTFAPSKNDIGSWLNFENKNDKLTISLNKTNIKAYLNRIAKDIEIQKVDKKVNSLTGEVIQEGKEGRYLEKDKIASELETKIASNSAVTINLTTYTEVPAEIKVIPAEGLIPGRFEGKYVDIDLANQKLCRVEGQNVIDCFTVSSGKPSMPTPTGTFSIGNKDSRKWSNKYSLWMPWWQEFYRGDYGLHELPEWPNGYKEGAAHLGIPVSHGCVRLGVGAAETLFNWTEIGTPVYIHK